MTTTLRLAALALLATTALACAAPTSDAETNGDDLASSTDDLGSGVNGGACKHSPYDCKLRVHGGNRIVDAQGSETWGVHQAEVVDGNGDFYAMDTLGSLKFNYGQTRRMNGVTYAFAMSTSAGSAGWFPIDEIDSAGEFRNRVGEVNAKDTHAKRLGCYEIANHHDPVLEMKKVVYDADQTHERAGDYLPLVRANGKRYANLAFNVPGFGLGGPAVDIFPAGTKFQRIDVPTDNGHPSIDIPLWVDAGNGHYTKKDGSLKFVYGFIVSKTGSKRFGWMAYPALDVSTSCPQLGEFTGRREGAKRGFSADRDRRRRRGRGARHTIGRPDPLRAFAPSCVISRSDAEEAEGRGLGRCPWSSWRAGGWLRVSFGRCRR